MSLLDNSVPVDFSKINIDLLRDQRDYLLEIVEYPNLNQNKLHGIINMLDYILDCAEGFEGFNPYSYRLNDINQSS